MNIKKRWGLLELQKACCTCQKSLISRRFKSVQENERKSKILSAISLISKLTDHHIRFFPKNERKTAKRLKKHIRREDWERPLVRRIFFQFWLGLDTSNPASFLKDQIFRFVWNIHDDSFEVSEFSLHRAVFNSDLYKIHKLCVGEDPSCIFVDIDGIDPAGNTPLMLAVKMKKYEAALVLIDHGADPKYRRANEDLSPIEQALGQGDRPMLRLLITGYLRQIREKWLGHNDDFLQALGRMKDFSMIMRWECKSSIIPFVKRFTPSDVYQIYKRGKNVRVDLTLIGWESLKSRRGKISLWFNGRKKKLKIFDHVLGSIRDFDSEPSEKSIENTVDKLMKNKKFSSDIQINDVKIVPDTNWRGQNQRELISNWECVKQKLTCSLEIEKEKRQVVLDKNLECFKNFEEYFEYASLLRPEDSNLTKSQKILETREKKHVSKQVHASIWTCQDFPLTLLDFLPLLELLGSFSKNAQHLCTFFHSSTLLESGFPVKALIPVYASVKLQVHLDSITLKSPEKSFFLFPRSEDRVSEESTAKIEEWTSDFFYQCEVSCSEDDNLLEAQQLFLSLKSLDSTPLLTDISIDDEDLEDEEEMPEISSLEVHHKLPSPRYYNRNSLPNTIIKKNELFKKVKKYAMTQSKSFKNDADVIL
jgi:hypothetical protein